VSAGDLAQALTAPAILEDRVAVEEECGAADRTALELGSPHASFDSFDDQAAFKFSDSADDNGDGAAQRAAGVDLLSAADELYL